MEATVSVSYVGSTALWSKAVHWKEIMQEGFSENIKALPEK